MDDAILCEAPLVVDNFACFESCWANTSVRLVTDYGFFSAFYGYDNQPHIDTIKRICCAICVILFYGQIVASMGCDEAVCEETSLSGGVSDQSKVVVKQIHLCTRVCPRRLVHA